MPVSHQVADSDKRPIDEQLRSQLRWQCPKLGYMELLHTAACSGPACTAKRALLVLVTCHYACHSSRLEDFPLLPCPCNTESSFGNSLLFLLVCGVSRGLVSRGAQLSQSSGWWLPSFTSEFLCTSSGLWNGAAVVVPPGIVAWPAGRQGTKGRTRAAASDTVEPGLVVFPRVRAFSETYEGEIYEEKILSAFHGSLQHEECGLGPSQPDFLQPKQRLRGADMPSCSGIVLWN